MIDLSTIQPNDNVRIISATPSWHSTETMEDISSLRVNEVYPVHMVDKGAKYIDILDSNGSDSWYFEPQQLELVSRVYEYDVSEWTID